MPQFRLRAIQHCLSISPALRASLPMLLLDTPSRGNWRSHWDGPPCHLSVHDQLGFVILMSIPISIVWSMTELWTNTTK